MSDNQVAENNTEQQNADEAAAFEAGFSGVHGDGQTAPPEKKDDAQASAPTEKVETAPEKKEESAPSADDQIKALKSEIERLAKRDTERDTEFKTYRETTEQQLQKAFGSIGELKNPVGKKIGVTKESLKRLNEEYPDLAEIFAEDFFTYHFPGAPDNTEAQTKEKEALIADIEGRVSKAKEEAKQEAFIDSQIIAIEDARGDNWFDEFNGKEFGDYLNTLSESEREKVRGATRAKTILTAFDGFDKWQAEKNKSAARQHDKTKRLERAIPANTGGTPASHSPSDDEAFLAGFKEARGARL